MLATLLVMAFASAPVEHRRVSLLDDRPTRRIRLVDDEDDHLDRDQESSSTRAARLELERPGYGGPIALGAAGLGLAGLGVVTVMLLNGGVIYVVLPIVGGLLMVAAAVVWGVHRSTERAEFDERIKGLKGRSAEQWRAPVQLPMMTLARF